MVSQAYQTSQVAYLGGCIACVVCDGDIRFFHDDYISLYAQN